MMNLRAIEWRQGDHVQRILVAGEDWLHDGLSEHSPHETTRSQQDTPIHVIVADRGALHLVSDDSLRSASAILLVNPDEDERVRSIGLNAGNPRVRIHVLDSHAADGAAEHAMTLMLGLSRRLFAAYSAVVDGSWSEPPSGAILAGKTLGVIGLGRSGQALARRASGFGMRLLYHDVERKQDVEARMGIEWRRFDQILRESDVVSLHVPATRDTFRMIDAPELAAMKSTALLINVADGMLIDEGSLAKTLRNGDIGGAGLDTFAYEPLSVDSPLIGFENVVLTPRVAWMTEEDERAMWLREAAEVLISAHDGESLK